MTDYTAQCQDLGQYLPFTPTTVFYQDSYCYYGIPNEDDARVAIDEGWTVTHNPNDLTGAGLFVQVVADFVAPVPPPPTTPVPPPVTLPPPVTAPPVGPTTPSQPPPTVNPGQPTAPVGPTAPTFPTEPTGTTWDGTNEGVDVNNAWAYYLDQMNNKLPDINTSLQNLSNKPISG